jgi:hypothetical protein
MYQHCKKDTNTPNITRTIYDNWLKGISSNLNINLKNERPRVIVTRHYLDNIIKFITVVPDDSIFDFRKVDYPVKFSNCDIHIHRAHLYTIITMKAQIIQNLN